MIDRGRCVSLALVLLGIACVLTGSILIGLTDSIVKKSVNKECQLNGQSMVYKLWRDAPVPLSISFYVFDLANGPEFLNGSKPRLVQRGPFVYREQRTKADIRFYENNTISYRELRNYTFDRSRSSEDETAMIKTINVVYMTLINYLQTANVPDLARRIIGAALSLKESPLMQRTVKEYLWGYEDPLLNMLKKSLPLLVPDDRISVFDSVVREGQYETVLINNGRERIDQVGRIERFNSSTSLSIWSNKYANMINGTDSTVWHPDVKKDELVYAFINDICRSVHLTYNQTRANSFAIDNYRYILTDDVFANSSDNEGFCVNQSQQLKCLPSGLFSLSPCVHLSGSPLSVPLPIIASNPHFLGADRAVRDTVNGLMPDETVHRSFIDIEPITGIVMNGSRRMQFNINVVNDSKIGDVSRLHSLVYPMMWIHEHAEIDQANADIFRRKLILPVTMLGVIKYLLLAIGSMLVLLALGLFLRRRQQDKITLLTVPVTTNDETTPLLE